MKNRRSQILDKLGTWLVYLFIALALIYILFPVYWMFISSFKSPARIFEVEYFPRNPTLINYRFLTFNNDLRYGFYNSILVTVSTVIITLIVGSLAAYAIGRLKFRGRGLIRYGILGMIAFPQIALVGGLYILVINPCALLGGECPQFSLYNTPLALILSYLSLTLPLTIWFMTVFYQSLPQEIEDAAYIDGASALQTLYYIFLPLSMPGLVTTGLVSFIVAWSEYIFAITFTIDNSARTAPIAVAGFGLGQGTFALAAVVLVTMPVMILVITFQKQLTTGLLGLAPPNEPFQFPFLKRLGLTKYYQVTAPEKILSFMATLAIISFLYHTWLIIPFPYPVDYAEGPLLDQLSRLANFQNIYRVGLSEPPYTITNYPPLYILLQVPCYWLFGPAYWYGRLLSWLGILLASTALGGITHTLTHDRRATALSSLMLLSVPHVVAWSPLYRIDSLALGLSLTALMVIVRWPDKWRSLILTAILLTAAIYTRQSYGLAAPFAAFIWLLTQPPRYRAFILLGLVTIMAGSILAWLNWLTQGGFIFNIINANINPFKFQLLYDYFEDLWLMMASLLILGSLFLLLGQWLQPKAWWLAAPYLVGAALSALTIGKVGSNVNYLLELCAALSLITGLTFAWSRRYPVIHQAFSLIMALQIFLFIPGSMNQWFSEQVIENRADQDRLFAIIQQSNGPILADEAMGLLPLAQRPIYMQPFEVTQLAYGGTWNEQPLVTAIAQKQFATILLLNVRGEDELLHDRWTPAMLQAIATNYREVNKVGDEFVYTVVYEPK